MLTIMPVQVTDKKVVLEKKDFDNLVERASQVEQVVISHDESEFTLTEMQDSLKEIWDNPRDKEVWQKYL